MARPTEEQVRAGQAVYTRRTLAAYDVFVLRLSNRYVWKCPSERIQAHYSAHLSANHLDVGVGTGYFLDQCRFPVNLPRVALMDLNPDALAYAAARIERYVPETHRHNVLQPVSAAIAPFDSVGINYLLHCLPGSMPEKAVAFDHLKRLMRPGAVIFGSTILQDVPRNWTAHQLMRLYNRRGIFTNTADDLGSLRSALQQRFSGVEVEVVGCVALFSGRCT